MVSVDCITYQMDILRDQMVFVRYPVTFIPAAIILIWNEADRATSQIVPFGDPIVLIPYHIA